ncbi:hypothetical protein [Halomonas sp. DQ26W]|uniref:hypothetical protein n=1 Tax=Halomonas sp. DQ26W TaxID=2282311 RepID=UPI0011C03B83|nr:hypothetical protein [Halomonas sp. DQ26W]
MAEQEATTACQTLPVAAWQRHGLLVLLCLTLLLFAYGAAAHVTLSPETHHGATGHVHDAVPTTAFVGDPHRGPRCHADHAPLVTHTLLRTERQDIEHGVALCSLAQLAPPAVLIISGTPHGRPDSNALPIYLLTQRLRH